MTITDAGLASDQISTRSKRTPVFIPGMALMWRYVRNHPGPFSLSVLGSTIFSAFSVGGTVVLGRLTDDLIIPGFADGVSGRDIGLGCLALFLVAVVRAIGVVMRRYFGAMATERQQATWRQELSDRFVSVPMSFFRDHPTGELLAHSDADVETSTISMQPLPMSIGVVVLFIAAFVSLLTADIFLLLVVVSLFPMLILSNRIYSQKVVAPAADVQAYLGDVSSVVHESVDGALVVKTLGREQAEVERLEIAAGHLRTSRIIMGRLRATFEPSIEAIPTLGVIALLAVGTWRVSTGDATAGDVVQSMLLLQILIFPMRVFGFLLEELPRSLVSAARLDGVLVAKSDDDGSAGGLPNTDPLSIEVRGLSFAYGDDEILSNVSFSVAPGEVVALVGSTGSGKSTLGHLLFRLARPTKGQILVGGVALDDLEANDLAEATALVFQESFLFADTVSANIDPDGSADREQIISAARLARAHTFIAEMPSGYDTTVGERGATLSGGQRQRVALARALLRRPQFIFLDDATSAVDATVEREILDGLGSELATTSLIVAQRLSTIRLADRVLFLDDGHIAATGTHDELLENRAYKALVSAYEDAS